MVDVTEDYSIDNSTLRSVRQKVVLVGDVAVGKTSIINRFTENKFNEVYDVISFLIISLQSELISVQNKLDSEVNI